MFQLSTSSLLHRSTSRLGASPYFVVRLHKAQLSSHFLKPHDSSSPFAYLGSRLQQCAAIQDVRYGDALHAQILKLGFVDDVFLSNHLINFYGKCQLINHAYQVFVRMPWRNVVSWTSLIFVYIQCQEGHEAIRLFIEVKKQGCWPNAFTMATAINACSAIADCSIGLKLHCQVEIEGFASNLVVGSALIDMYGKCGFVDDARRIFDNMTMRNVVTWTSMISICAQNGHGHEAIELFGRFRACLLVPNEFTFASVINASASLGCLGAGKLYHSAIIHRNFDQNDVVTSALIDMYAKCGCLDYSIKVFRQVPDPKVIQWTSIIMGHAQHGLGHEGLELFDEMIRRGIQPNDVTFVGALYACSHSGLVDRGKRIFASMPKLYRVVPDTKHYTCMVDMLGRAGHLDEANELITTMPVQPDALLWGALLSASRVHGRIELAIKAAESLIELNQQLASTYVTLANMYTSVGRWGDAMRMRREMKIRGIHKEPGCSWVEIKGNTYTFFAGDELCANQSEAIRVLQELEKKIKERGHVADNSLVFHDVEEEAKEAILGFHSERMALAFALVNTPEGSTVRVTKNLRMCTDCHQAFKFICEIVSREITVRDVNRFHHFRDGLCSCRDYW